MSRPFIIAGPCSAESEESLLRVAHDLKAVGADAFRAGLWKPRTHPGSFSGVGSEGIGWMLEVKRSTGLPIATEVLDATHAELCRNAGFDILWIGARTTSNPYLVQEIAEALSGAPVTVLVKNPLSPDLELWTGALERFGEAGVGEIVAVHRGFTPVGKTKYRNEPYWEAALSMKGRFPGMRMLCDPSHIAGKAGYVAGIAGRAVDLGFDGLMVECHPDPEKALTDSAQQIKPSGLAELLRALERNDGDAVSRRLAELREKIDIVDERIVDALGDRLAVCREIGRLKRETGMQVRQQDRWDKLMETVLAKASMLDIPESMIRSIFDEIHNSSIEEQHKITQL